MWFLNPSACPEIRVGTNVGMCICHPSNHLHFRNKLLPVVSAGPTNARSSQFARVRIQIHQSFMRAGVLTRSWLSEHPIRGCVPARLSLSRRPLCARSGHSPVVRSEGHATVAWVPRKPPPVQCGEANYLAAAAASCKPPRAVAMVASASTSKVSRTGAAIPSGGPMTESSVQAIMNASAPLSPMELAIPA